MAGPSGEVGKRSVGRPRQFDDDVERRLILDAAYAALRDHGPDFTIANILSTAGVSTRSFYRHFDSKDTLLHAMYLRDGEWAAERLTKRLADASSPRAAVEWWIDEIFSFTRSPRRAERVSVLGSITGVRATGAHEVPLVERSSVRDSPATHAAAALTAWEIRRSVNPIRDCHCVTHASHNTSTSISDGSGSSLSAASPSQACPSQEVAVM